MANDIFDWDDDVDQKRPGAEVSSVNPPAGPDAVISAPSDAPTQPPVSPIPPRQAAPDRPEIDTLIRPRREPFDQYPFTQQTPQPDAWVDYPPDAFDQPPQQPGVWSEYKPESADESARQGGLAWSAGIVFFSSVGFMLFLGWIADWLLGSSPWGIIGGIVLGSILGFVQFFRISSRIFGAKKGELAERPLMPHDDEPV